MDAVISALEKLGQLISQEAAFLGEYRDKVEWLERTMRRISCSLADADAKGRKKTQGKKNWIREIRTAAYEVQDLIDDIRSESEKKWHRRRKKGFLGLISRYACAPYECLSRHRLLLDIEQIQKKIEDINTSKNQFESSNDSDPGIADGCGHNSTKILTLYHTEYDEKDVVGLVKDKRDLIKRLLYEENKRRAAICLVGMVGLGKTTLAKTVYGDSQVRKRFPMRHWITVTKNCRVPELLDNINEWLFGHTVEEMKKMDAEKIREIFEPLKEKRYLIVLDDVWTIEAWNHVRQLLLDFGNGSRIMLTTRFEEVAQSVDPSSKPHQLRYLDPDDSWELLFRKAFPVASESTHSLKRELNDVGRDLASKCRGLPLALVVLGGILLNKASRAAWQEVEGIIDWRSDRKCYDMVALSYDDLPHSNLKSCFLYISSFPEFSEISTSKLVDLWIALSMVEKSDRLTLEQTARGYLEELIQRCMVQVVERSFAHRRAKSIRIHDLLRDWIISEARDGGFLEFFSCNFKNEGKNPPDACLAGDEKRYEASSNLRSLLVVNKCFGNNDSRLCFEQLRRLRALDLEGAKGITELPRNFNQLKHLRYLGLRYSSIKKIPDSIGDLHYLQTLDARESEISQLPCTLWRIPTLEKVRAGSVLNPISTSGIETSKSLEVLGWVRAGEWIDRWSQVEDASRRKLRRLAIASIGEAHQEAIIRFLRELQHLSSLSLDIDGMTVDALTSSARSFSKNLGTLKLRIDSQKAILQLPLVCDWARNVSKLELNGIQFSEDPMEALGKLPDLVELVISNFSISCSKEMACSAGGFPQLRRLKVGNSHRTGIELQQLKVVDSDETGGIEVWSVEESAMRCLTHLSMFGMKKLIQVPHGFQHLTNLQELTLEYMSDAFRDRIQEKGGQDWHLISHVPIVRYTD